MAARIDRIGLLFNEILTSRACENSSYFAPPQALAFLHAEGSSRFACCSRSCYPTVVQVDKTRRMF